MKQTISKAKIKKGDKVAVIAGKDNGKSGIVEKTLPKEQRILVKGINLVKKHIKPKGKQQPGQIITMEKTIAMSNVQLICPSCNKRSRITYKMTGKIKQRICKKCGQVIEVKKEAKKS